jgi:hypothetical protein
MYIDNNNLEDGESMFSLNISIYLHIYTVLTQRTNIDILTAMITSNLISIILPKGTEENCSKN